MSTNNVPPNWRDYLPPEYGGLYATAEAEAVALIRYAFAAAERYQVGAAMAAASRVRRILDRHIDACIDAIANAIAAQEAAR